jgi:hypothetical protein
MHRRRLAVLLTAALACPTVSVRAQDMDMDVLNKWSAFAVIHYVVVGEFSGAPTGVLLGAASATDRVEVTFDWNQNETALVGTPTFKNFPGTAVPPAPGGPCPMIPMRYNGTYDYFTLNSVAPVSTRLQLIGTRSYPAAVVAEEVGRECKEATVPAKTQEAMIWLVVQTTMAFGMRGARGAGTSISKDGKSIVVVDQENPGWTWTYTPTGLR